MSESMLYHLIYPKRETDIIQKSVVFIRVMLGAVFISEGIQKFLFSDSLGVGRFIKIGIPAPNLTAPFVGAVEIICGTLILFGLFTSLASIPLIISMSVAIWTTKVPILMEKGFWAMAHEARTDWSMIIGLIFILISGGGQLSMDWFRMKKFLKGESQEKKG